MIELIIVMAALVGALCFLYAALAGLADYVLPHLASKPWRTHRRPAATRRAR